MYDQSRCQNSSGFEPPGWRKIGPIWLCFIYSCPNLALQLAKAVLAFPSPLLRPPPLALKANAWLASCCLLIVLIAGKRPAAK